MHRGAPTRVVDELPESVALGTAGATHLLCVCDFGGQGLLAGVAPAAARPRPPPRREPRGAAVLRELARRGLVAPTVGRFEVVGNIPGAADYLQACGRAHEYSDSIEVLVADGRRPVSCLQLAVLRQRASRQGFRPGRRLRACSQSNRVRRRRAGPRRRGGVAAAPPAPRRLRLRRRAAAPRPRRGPRRGAGRRAPRGVAGGHTRGRAAMHVAPREREARADAAV